jgi:hypothetical protein
LETSTTTLKENNMFFESSESIVSLYGMDFKPVDMYEEKRKAALEYLGEKYLLAKPVERKNG